MDVKCVVLGDSAVGKTTLIHTFLGHNVDDFACGNISPFLFHDEKDCHLSMIDAGSDNAYDVPANVLETASVIVICYSIISPQSFDSISDKWIPMIKASGSKAPLLIVGTKADLRSNEGLLTRLKRMGLKPVETKQGKAIAKQLKAVHFQEISLQGEEAREYAAAVFGTATQHVKKASPKKSKSKVCSVV